ncbi:phospholipase D-like domain-containing protein [Thermoflexus sp.]|uniref:phospholipase D-like domain-containing protein n=1 Tax=Thermoflexus sp. TaxID=1969742 RepID=UPI0025F428B6|nr:phospholipase D-like domain-containing protein [Thermoflexus sp.]MCS6962493.1 phospholipase D-like domain-containing protein [Thermoflexus sp.]MDW8183661.1 phospholipase D-like domain-containing protein [Anaerolineae bacterium]
MFPSRPRPARKGRWRSLRRTPSLVGLVSLLLLAVGIFVVQRCLALPEAPSTPAPEGRAGWYEVFFTTPRFPDDPDLHRGGVVDSLIAAIDSARQTLDVAVYDIDLMPVAEALLRARDRGIRVRVVTETDNADTKAIARLRAGGIPVVTDEREGYMHNKFMVIDGERVWTGSMNFTDNDAYQNNNNAALIHSPDLARNYAIKFAAMFERRAFGPARSSGDTVPQLTIEGIPVENYFAPEDPTVEAIRQVIQGARERIVFMAFSFTHPQIGNALLERAQAGVEIHGVFETVGAEAPASQFRRLRRAGIDVLKDGNPYNMHHKVFIIDRRIVLFGSYNFSRNAAQDNDENFLIVADPGMAMRFEAEFARVYEQALNPPRAGWPGVEWVFASR